MGPVSRATLTLQAQTATALQVFRNLDQLTERVLTALFFLLDSASISLSSDRHSIFAGVFLTFYLIKLKYFTLSPVLNE
jgi:hypothetical protein